MRIGVFVLAIALPLFVAAPQVYGASYEYFRVSGPLVKGMYHGELYELKASQKIITGTVTELYESRSGQQVVIEHTLTNNSLQPFGKPVIAITEVRDNDGFTLFLAFQSLDLAPSETGSIGTSWLVPSDAQSGDVYKVRFFVVTSLSVPEGLTPVFAGEIKIVEPVALVSSKFDLSNSTLLP